MNLKGFTFLLTAQCNFRCSYCIQEKTESFLSEDDMERAIDLFLPDFADRCRIGFYGGEPLLAFDRMREAVEYIEQKGKESDKRIHYDLTTNGILLDEEILSFLDTYRFTILLSFDGLAQEQGRPAGTMAPLLRIIEKLNQKPYISYWVHSVFTPSTVSLLAESTLFLEQQGVNACTFTFDLNQPWDSEALEELRSQVREAGRLWRERIERNGAIRILNFSQDASNRGLSCSAGRDRLAIAPGGGIWACAFPASFEFMNDSKSPGSEFFLAKISDLNDGWRKRQREVLQMVYGQQFEQRFAPGSPCTSCNLSDQCFVCPYEKSVWIKKTGMIPFWICAIVGIIAEEKKRAIQKRQKLLH